MSGGDSSGSESSGSESSGSGLCYRDQSRGHYNNIIIMDLLTITSKELHLTNCKLKIAAELVHQHPLCIEVDIDIDILATSIIIW